MTRISTSAQSQYLLEQSQKTKATFDRVTRELNSGKRSENYAEIPKDVERLLTTKSDLKTAQGYLRNIEIVENREKIVLTGLEQIYKISKDFEYALGSALSGDANFINTVNLLGHKARGNLEQVVDTLNVQDDMGYLFSGTLGQKKPVDLNHAGYTSPPSPSNGVAFSNTTNTSYYFGNDVPLSILIDQEKKIEYGITANHPGFEKIIRAMDHFAQMSNPNYATVSDPLDGPPSPSQRQYIQNALMELSSGLGQLEEVMANSVFNQQQIAESKRQYQEFESRAANVVHGIENVERIESMVRLIEQQLQLQASYKATVQAQELTLLNFMD